MNVRNLAVWGALALLVIGMAVMMGGNPEVARAKNVRLSEIYTMAEQGKLADATLGDTKLVVTTTDGQKLISEIRQLDMTTETVLRDNNVPFNVEADVGRNNVASVLLSLLPIVLIVAFVFFMMRQMQGGGTRGAMSFGKSRARLLTEKHGRVTFDDVAGVDEAKEELQEIVEFLQDPSKFQRLGGKIPKGALPVGPPMPAVPAAPQPSPASIMARTFARVPGCSSASMAATTRGSAWPPPPRPRPHPRRRESWAAWASAEAGRASPRGCSAATRAAAAAPPRQQRRCLSLRQRAPAALVSESLLRLRKN